tara:strand:+ start:81 stop:677 length:597 start_codon:yes stop_codon:yes gene_type:complete
MSFNLYKLHLTQKLEIFQNYFSRCWEFPQTNSVGSDHSSSNNFLLASLVAHIIEKRLYGSTSNWLALKKEMFGYNKPSSIQQKHPLVSMFSFNSKLVYQTYSREKNTLSEYVDKYKIVFIPGFDNYIVTLSSKNLNLGYFKHFAIGNTDGSTSPIKAATKIINRYNQHCQLQNNLKENLITLQSGIIHPQELASLCFE